MTKLNIHITGNIASGKSTLGRLASEHIPNACFVPDCAYCFVDAGAWTNRLVYSQYLYHERIITAEEHAFYETLCDLIERAYHQPQPDGFVFVSASPQTCWERMHQRGWTYQTTTIELAYIEKLNPYFELMKQAIAGKSIPLMEISSEDIDFTTPEGQQEALGKLKRFLERYQRPHP
jgi:deoxyadenosine/deoxycytidine kinase